MNIYITGASSGIGEYVSYEYAKKGNHLALCARRKEKLEDIATKCREMGAKVTIYSVDVTDQHSTKESIDDFLSKITKIDLVIANAGLGYLDALHKGDPTLINEVIKVNVIGV
ncbi:SDR family oxidoreductase, partial [bacterium]|nr:SDR family oxidoreductase [bacterium]